MKIIELDGQFQYQGEPVCSAIGFFDGLHKGHMALVESVLKVSKEKGYKSALMTFDHHPLYVLGLINEEKQLTSMHDRQMLLEQKGIDYLFIIRFDQDVAKLSCQDFIERYIVSQNIQHVVCGYDFRFGDHHSGNAQTLKQDSRFETTVEKEVMYDSEKISSSRIRDVLSYGYVDKLVPLLGRHYCLSGKVIMGQQIGRTIGFPTANVDYGSYWLPHRGVYVVKFYCQQGCFMGMCNIGFNPTLQDLKRASLEVYILDFQDDIYGQEVQVEFYQMLRLEKKFHSYQELVAQLESDVKSVREYFKDGFKI